MEFAIQWIKVTCILGIWVEISVPYNWNYPEKTFDQFDSLGNVIVKNARRQWRKLLLWVSFWLIRKNLLMSCVVGRIIPPKMLLLESGESVKRDFANVIRLWTLRWGDSPGISGWVQNNQKGLPEWKREAGEAEFKKEMWPQKQP